LALLDSSGGAFSLLPGFSGAKLTLSANCASQKIFNLNRVRVLATGSGEQRMYAGETPPIPSETTLASRRALLGARTRPISVTSKSKLLCCFQSPEALSESIIAQWIVLADQAAEPNSFAERWFLQPSLALLAEKGDVQIAVVTSHSGLLVGLVPLTVKPKYGRIPVANVQNWMHHNSFLGVPLVRRGMETQFWQVLLSALDETDWARGLLHINGLPDNGRTIRGLQEAAASLGRSCDIVHRTRRALLKSSSAPDEYWETNVRKKKRKELDRLANRLGELGSVSYTTLGPDEDAAPWIADFLTLEKNGWKGKAGSAIGCDPKLIKFLEIAAEGAHAAGKLDFHRLDLDGKPIAMLINFLATPGGFSFKIAFDEEYARYSPGVLIERYNLRILENRDIDWIDSCAIEGHSMIDSLWSERRDILRVSVPLGGARSGLLFRACRAAENTAAQMRGIARKRKERRDG
jgi:CelD/BcsL family acetyltransferase involved in cellulose biosynthesis